MDDAAENLTREGAPGLGATLAAERQRQGLSRADVAQRLHMSPSQVEAIEVDAYERLPRGPFVRGFVRNYAKALGLAPEPLLEMLAGTAPPAPAPGIVVPTQNIRFDPLGERLTNPYVRAATLALVAIALAFAAMYWVMFVHPRPPALVAHPSAARPGAAAVVSSPLPATTPGAGASGAAASRASSPSMAPSAPSTSSPSSSPPSSPLSSSQPAPGMPHPLAASASSPPAAAKPAAPAEATKAATAVPAAGARRLAFHFNGESWVEVRDASGNAIFQKLNPAGSDAQVSGQAPLQVVVGNAPEVEMRLDGRPYDLDPYTKVAVARFTLE